MAEYSVGDSPLWCRMSKDDEALGLTDAEDLRLSAGLRRDLAAWNDVYDAISGTDFRFPSDEIRDAHAVDAFTLAGRVQQELGDDIHVWCAAGDGIDTYPTGGVMFVVSAGGGEGTVERWYHDSRTTIATAATAGSPSTIEKIEAWRALTRSTTDPLFGDATTRVRGLRVAGELQRDIGAAAHVIFFSGARSPDDYRTLFPPAR